MVVWRNSRNLGHYEQDLDYFFLESAFCAPVTVRLWQPANGNLAHVWGKNASADHPVLYFCVPSAEYDLYLQQTRRLLNDKGDMLSSLYTDVSNNYTNIQGATGVFGALNVLRYDCDCSGSPRDKEHRFYYQMRLNLMTPAPLPEL